MGVFPLSPNKSSVSEDLSFEEALRELEATVAALEAGGAPLERSLQMLQRGLELATRCETVLDQAQLTIEHLTMTPDGELITQRMSEDVDGE